MTHAGMVRARAALSHQLIAHADPLEGPLETWVAFAQARDPRVDAEEVRDALSVLCENGALEPAPGRPGVWRRRAGTVHAPKRRRA